METIQIEILNPKAKKLLKNLADLKLIAIRESDEKEFKDLLKKLRARNSNKLSIEEITKEVDIVREERHGRKAD